VRIVLADDHAAVRGCLRTILEFESDFHVVGEAADGKEAIELAEQARPDVILMDVNMPRTDGVEATRAITSRHPEIGVVGLSANEEHRSARAMLAAGAAAYVSKSADVEEIAGAVRAAAVNGR
jgi:DNA-binding NarL/FixJ family response regulator